MNDWHEQVDVILVGAGASGFTAAVVAAEYGADAVILEKGLAIGGTSTNVGRQSSWTVDGRSDELVKPRVPGAGPESDTMVPLSDHSPYYATIIVPGTLDTKGGPKTNSYTQVLDHLDRPIPGPYTVGNCAALPSAGTGEQAAHSNR